MIKTKFVWKSHPNPKLQLPWYLTQFGLLIFPLIPSLGAASFVFASVQTWRQQHRKIINSPLNWGFAFLSLLLIVTAGLADDKIAAFLGLFNFLPFFLFFAVFSTLIQTKAQLRQLSWILVIGSIPVVVIGIGHMFWGWSISQFWEIIFGWQLKQEINPPTRMASVMMNSNLLAAYLVMVFILGLGLWIENWQEINSVEEKTDNKKFILPSLPIPFLFFTLVLIADFVALILTHSRNGWGNAIFACIAYALYQSWYWIIAGVIAIATSIIIAARAPLAIAQWFRKIIPQFFWIRLHNQVYSDTPLPIHRKTQWEFALNLIQQRPWSGWGLRNFSLLYEAQTQHWLGHPHNLFLMLSAEAGVPTALLFYGLLAWLFVTSIQLMLNSKSIIFFSYLLSFAAWMIFNVVDVTIFDFRLNTLLWLTLAAVCGVSYNYNSQLKKQQNLSNAYFYDEDSYLISQIESR